LKILTGVGDWLAIYGTRSWHVYGEGPTQVIGGAFTQTKQPAYTDQDIRFTIRDDTL
jgi:alpha-L-fucosidase